MLRWKDRYLSQVGIPVSKPSYPEQFGSIALRFISKTFGGAVINDYCILKIKIRGKIDAVSLNVADLKSY